MKIMLVDDDASIKAAVEDIVVQEGYNFCYAADAAETWSVLDKENPDLMILDVMLPATNGFDLCRQLRHRGKKLPIIFLTAKGDIVDKSIGFRAGGDDYLVKPFNPLELSLRIEALLRRFYGEADSSFYLERDDSLVIGELEIIFGHYVVKRRGKKVELTSKEFEILALMASHPGRVYTREQIAEHIWGRDNTGDLSNVTVFIRRIREKIEDNPSQPEYLLTVWRVGYKFSEEV